ncbi:VOC family protein [uncultured Shewanella sp.]|uniref:VOC family protein n=1 Tax=uncultured Shewanella sp. TaxID=173975 RepID=UPI002626BD3C|nr:VOC family protein [uncultured Shewanella sp.]
MSQHEKMDYIEFSAKNLLATKTFFTQVFGWTFEDFGPDYTAFDNAGLRGGFFHSDLSASTSNGSALMVFFSHDLEATQDKIIQSGGKVIKPIFSFPGGRRFHFTEPSGNEFAVWAQAT